MKFPGAIRISNVTGPSMTNVQEARLSSVAVERLPPIQCKYVAERVSSYLYYFTIYICDCLPIPFIRALKTMTGGLEDKYRPIRGDVFTLLRNPERPQHEKPRGIVRGVRGQLGAQAGDVNNALRIVFCWAVIASSSVLWELASRSRGVWTAFGCSNRSGGVGAG